MRLCPHGPLTSFEQFALPKRWQLEGDSHTWGWPRIPPVHLSTTVWATWPGPAAGRTMSARWGRTPSIQDDLALRKQCNESLAAAAEEQNNSIFNHSHGQESWWHRLDPRRTASCLWERANVISLNGMHFENYCQLQCEPLLQKEPFHSIRTGFS